MCNNSCLISFARHLTLLVGYLEACLDVFAKPACLHTTCVWLVLDGDLESSQTLFQVTILSSSYEALSQGRVY